MYVIRDIFQLKFAHFKDVKALLEEGKEMGIFPQKAGERVLSDFTGDAYRLVMEHTYPTLAAYEEDMKTMGKPEWQQWYAKFGSHIEGSHREIMKQIM